MIKQTKMGWKATMGGMVLGYFPTEGAAKAALGIEDDAREARSHMTRAERFDAVLGTDEDEEG